jgi:LacI family repressor for deo operon, udp, cdd, tsx, nupC, and nupG
MLALTINVNKRVSMGVTIKEVAKEAGVSLMTVSRVVNNKGNIAKSTRENVLQAIKKLNYKPNRLARSLVVQKSDFISVIVPDITNPFFAELVKGAENLTRKRGCNIILGDTEGEREHEKEYIEAAIGRMADGIILVAPRIDDALIYEVNELIPLVIVDRYVPNEDILQIYIDNLEGAFLAVEHLIELGHRRIGFLSGPKDVLNSLRREEGYRKALERHDIPYDPALTLKGDFYFQSGYTAFDSFYQLNPPPTAIFASNDLMAFGLIQRANEQGVRIPDNLSIIGFDDIALSALINPPLTTIRHPMVEMGIRAVKLLFDQLGQREEKQIESTLQNTLIIRQSTKTFVT